MKKNIAFLFGAGVSIPSGFPKTEELTDYVLKGENIVRLSGKYYYKEYPDQFSYIIENEYINRIKKLLHILHNYFEKHYSFIDRGINYEDYYYMCDSMESDENSDYENPLVEYFSDHLYKVHSYLFEPLCDLYSSFRLIDLMNEAKKYIRDVVTHYLDKKTDNLCQFNILNDVKTDNDKVFIATLNHDLLIEKYLRSNSIFYSDGFVEKNINSRIWEKYSFTEKFNLLKLHGSIDWVSIESDDPYQRKVHITSQRYSGEDSPVIMVGSFNKLRDYSRGTFFDLQCLFSEFLESCDRIVVSGYSFGDQGINSRIINWLFRKPERKVVVIHKNEDELFRNSRNAIISVWSNDKKDKTDLIRIIPKWFQETNWEEIKSELN